MPMLLMMLLMVLLVLMTRIMIIVAVVVVIVVRLGTRAIVALCAIVSGGATRTSVSPGVAVMISQLE